MKTSLPVGKLPSKMLGKMLMKLEGHPRLIIGPRVGEDAAVIEWGERYLVAKSDPVTFVEGRIGWYAVHVNANDIACMGAKPFWFLMTLLLPENLADEKMVETIWVDVRSACEDLGITLCGGHTEITQGLTRPILCGQMLGEVNKERLVRGDGAQSGDVILLTRAIPVEGTAILAAAKRQELIPTLGSDLINRAENYLQDPGISVVRLALAAAETGSVNAMHDPTEGGLATGVHELAEAARLGALVEKDAVPISEEGLAICSSLGIDPLGVITSGALLLAVPSENENFLRGILEEMGGLGVRIGTLLPPAEGVTILQNGKRFPLPRFDADEISKVL